MAGFAAIILPQSLLASGCTALGASVAYITDLESGFLSGVLFLILRGGGFTSWAVGGVFCFLLSEGRLFWASSPK